METLQAAQALFSQMLGTEGCPGARYLAGDSGERRPTSPEVAATAGLGYAYHGYTAILVEWGCTTPELIEAGLLDEKHQEVYGDRLTFPWLNTSGRAIVGLGGRAVTMRRPKYVNTPEPLFTKGSAVFGLAQAAQSIHGSGYAIVCEGPFDALALWDMGWTNAVATVGARVTPDQLTMVLRLTDQVVVLLDSDEGGRRGRDALTNWVQGATLPGRCHIYAGQLVGPKDPGDPATTPGHITTALANADEVAHI